MNNMKTVLYVIAVLMFLAVHCNALVGKRSKQSINKRGCLRLGEACNTESDCCGHDDPDSGHCVLCVGGLINYFFDVGKRTCSCSSYSAGADPETNKIVTDVCDGRDRTGSRVCRTRLARPDENFYRGDDYYNSHRRR